MFGFLLNVTVLHLAVGTAITVFCLSSVTLMYHILRVEFLHIFARHCSLAIWLGSEENGTKIFPTIFCK